LREQVNFQRDDDDDDVRFALDQKNLVGFL